MYRVPAIAVLLAAAAFPPSLEGQMRAVQRPKSWGLQIGVEAVDLVMIIQNEKGMQHLLSNKFHGSKIAFVMPDFLEVRLDSQGF